MEIKNRILFCLLFCCLFTSAQVNLQYSENTNRPALIPTPKQVSWGKGFFDLAQCKYIVNALPAFESDATYLQKKLLDLGLKVEVVKEKPKSGNAIVFHALDNATAKEAYLLAVEEKQIKINASNGHGIFNGVQTLLQLSNQQKQTAICSIVDEPAFSIRGYMFDVGRNYQSIPLIKQQLDVMAMYKLNAYHMHLTEDIAWRIESKIFPKLNDSSLMIRNKGKFYTYQELRELVEYCRARHIEFIPEIDMPGHSAAFKRATGFDMQSPEGKAILKQVLQEFMAEVDVPYFHLGGDEVVYKDKNFLKDIADLMLAKGKKLIAWDPGGTVPAGTIHQLWNGNKKPWTKEPNLDSRHLYLNHFDPLEGVVATFNHSMLDVDKGDSIHLGGILCNWPDRRLENENDALRMSPTYPAMLAFAERCWKGGGYHQLSSDMGKPGEDKYEAFAEFEARMLSHKKMYFQSLPFPYAKQTGIEWNLMGPFDNKGIIATQFLPEQPSYWDTANFIRAIKVYGGTIWLRHFWHPMIASHLKAPAENTTWYAYRKFYSDKATEQSFWIGFNNISRSHQAPAPPMGSWDDRGSMVWVNGVAVDPPVWKNGNRKTTTLEDPLVDEGYEYRAPTKIHLKKGWNTILIKAPVASFKSAWYAPVKWMFSFVAVD